MLKKLLILSLLFLANKSYAGEEAGALQADAPYRLFLKKDTNGKLREDAQLILERAELSKDRRLSFMDHPLVSLLFLNYIPKSGALPQDVTMVGMAKLMEDKDLLDQLVTKYHHEETVSLAISGKSRR